MIQDLDKDRHADIDQKLWKAGIDPDLINTRLHNDIYKLPDEHIGTLTGTFLTLRHWEFDDQELTKGQLNYCLVYALVRTKKLHQYI